MKEKWFAVCYLYAPHHIKIVGDYVSGARLIQHHFGTLESVKRLVDHYGKNLGDDCACCAIDNSPMGLTYDVGGVIEVM